MLTRSIASACLVGVLIGATPRVASPQPVGTSISVARRLDEVLELLKISGSQIKTWGALRKVAEITEKLQDLTPDARRAVCLAIARERKILSSAEADELYQWIHDVSGVDKPLRLLLTQGDNGRQASGALRELLLAAEMRKAGMRVISMREPFLEDAAKRWTDIDLLLENKSGHTVAVECKSYVPKLSEIGPDARTLAAYRELHPDVALVLSLPTSPDADSLRLLAKLKVTLITGIPTAQAVVIGRL